METIIAAINSKPAGEGFGSVLLAALTAIGVMALIYGVLEFMNYVRRRKGGDDKPQSPQPPQELPENRGSLFARVLAKRMEQKYGSGEEINDDDDKDLRA